jgi:MFS family permease
LMIICLMISAVAFCLLVVPGPVWLVGLSTILIGLGLGIAATLSLSSVVELAPKEARGTAVTLRITGNRVGQVTLPMLGGALAAALGAGGILATIGLAIGMSGFAVWSSYLRRPKR